MKLDELKSAAPLSSASDPSAINSARARLFVICAAVLVGAFSLPLWRVIQLALHEEIQSHILLIPFVSIYLWKISKNGAGADSLHHEASLSPGIAGSRTLAAHTSPGILLFAFFLCACASAALSAYLFGARHAWSGPDALSLVTVSFLLFLYAAAAITLGWPLLRPRLFALGFLLFMVPLPDGFVNFLSIGLQYASAEAADWMIALTGMPTYREGLVFQFAGRAIRVAEECSGIRSTFVLFITSILAGHLFLKTGWKKALLAFAIFPVGIARNGFRITLISWLTVNVDPGIIDSPLHHHGGPLFFALSLVPLFAILWWLRRSDLRTRAAQ